MDVSNKFECPLTGGTVEAGLIKETREKVQQAHTLAKMIAEKSREMENGKWKAILFGPKEQSYRYGNVKLETTGEIPKIALELAGPLLEKMKRKKEDAELMLVANVYRNQGIPLHADDEAGLSMPRNVATLTIFQRKGARMRFVLVSKFKQRTIKFMEETCTGGYVMMMDGGDKMYGGLQDRYLHKTEHADQKECELGPEDEIFTGINRISLTLRYHKKSTKMGGRWAKELENQEAGQKGGMKKNEKSSHRYNIMYKGIGTRKLLS